ncbi:E3 ubiquitin-protein ligase UBR4-like isoform X2 [Physella acuta]|uniref:E3 ubiquitin-protein ligase UBR4-like isoform X2 n=1 Tax=Physella acuta TaxID=109671 RepID=UPI0027DBAF6E|nr:E3 ubiquitin-protein ligase UBR4-like isoform X2 [Physella acuta]
MAMSSDGGLTWSAAKNLLTSSYSSLDKKDLQEISKLIIEREKEILNHAEESEAFFSLFVALASNALCSLSGSLSKSNLPQVASACKVLLSFLLNRLETPNKACAVTPKYLVILINGLCRGGQCLSRSDVVTFNCLFKPAEPPFSKEEKNYDAPDKEKSKDKKLPRLDTQTDLFDQMTSVFSDMIPTSSASKSDMTTDLTDKEPKTPVSLISQVSEGTEDLSNAFAQKNTESLLNMNGADILLGVCTQLTFLSKYMQRYKDALAGSAFLLPGTLSQALTTRNGYQFLLTEVSDVWRAFSLPILEPLTPKRLKTIVEITLGCLFAAVSVATADTVVNAVRPSGPSQAPGAKDEEMDNQGHSIVQKSLEIFNWVSSAVKTSTRAGGSVAQNLNLLAAWETLKGLQGILLLTPAAILERKDFKPKTPAEATPKKEPANLPARPTSAKSGPPFLSVTAVALATNAIQLLTPLLEDLNMEGSDENISSSPPGDETGLEINLLENLTAWARVKHLLRTICLPDLMIQLMSTAFKKAVYLKRMKQGSDSQETISSSSTSDSNTFYEDDFSTSEESSEDDDSEPILGQWLEEALSPCDSTNTAPPPPLPPRVDALGGEGKRQRETSVGERSPSFVPDKREPEGFTNLVSTIMNFLNTHLLTSRNENIRFITRSSITQEQVSLIAQLTKDLDKECARVDNDKGYTSVSVMLARFNHNLIATEVLSESLQDCYLTCLGVSPTSPDPWPLTVHPRCLSVLVSVLLLRQQQERGDKELKAGSADNAVIAIWDKFLKHLQTAVENSENKTEIMEDVNVEHVQVLMFLFHGLRLAQKKGILIKICQIILDVSQTERNRMERTVPLALSRLVLILEYLLHFFYDPPALLMEQVQHNLFTLYAQSGDKETSTKSIKYFPCREVEENFRRSLQPPEASEGSMKPRFYHLCPPDPNIQDVAKIDGLALGVLLGREYKLNYNQFYSSCIRLLMAGSQCDKTKEKLSLLDASAMHYHFLLLWRLLSCLPPSVDYIHLLKNTNVSMEGAYILHTLRWAPRIGHKYYGVWTQECLVKQGLNPTEATEIVETAAALTNTSRFDVMLAMSYIREQISKLPCISTNELSSKDLPGMSDILILDAMVAKCQVSLDETYTKAMTDPEPNKAMQFTKDLIPAIFTLIEAFSAFARSCILTKVATPEDKTLTSQRLKAFGQVLSVGSSHPSAVKGLGSSVVGLLPSSVRNAVDKWNSSGGNEFPTMGAWRNAFAADPIPSESYIDAIHSAHMVTLSGQSPFCINASLRHVLHSLVRFGSDLIVWCPDDANSSELIRVMFPLIYDVTTEYLKDMVMNLKEKFLGPQEEARFEEKAYKHAIQACDQVIVEFSDAESGLDEKILYECIKFIETNLEKPAARKAFTAVYTDNADITSLLLSVARSNLSDTYTTHILRFFIKLFHLAEREPNDENLRALCQGLTRLATVDKVDLQNFLTKIIKGLEETSDETVVRENNNLLQTLFQHIVRERSPIGEDGVITILQAILPMGGPLLESSQRSDLLAFPDLMVILQTLAGAGSGYGHVLLFQTAQQWLELCKSSLTTKETLETAITNENEKQGLLETLCCLLSYIGEILGALKITTDRARSYSPLFEQEILPPQESEGDWAEDLGHDDEDSAGEDSDEETLNNKLCTFTITQKEFMNQHWYHCHTCKMVDGVGVCTMCAKVCHKDHDLTYAKFGSFFCDCGAKEDGSCKALIKRTALGGLDSVAPLSQSPFALENLQHHSSLRRRLSPFPDNEAGKSEGLRSLELYNKAREALCAQIQNHREQLLTLLNTSETITNVLHILNDIVPPLSQRYQVASLAGSSINAQKALQDLHCLPKEVESTTTDQLMTVTLGSQEGAFENVRMNYSGDQGQAIRQLITTHMLRRVAMCVLSSPQGKRQHLAVSHEKGKMTILQLSALLKQADSSKKKLTLTRLSSAPVPFTVLSITGNPCNEDYLAVCGLKDCHVMTFTSSGAVADHLVLHPSLATGNFIIKAIWLPGSQTELAIVTADFVKIYDLGVDAISPQYYFLLPSGKIRDVTFIFNDESRAMIMMASSGYIYTQTLEDSSSAKHGPFYITNVMEVKHTDLKDINGQVAGGGVSVYYSHALQLIFFSYSSGKSFAAPVAKDLSTVTNLFPITFKCSNGGSKGGNSQPLVSWSEVPGHTGLLYCMAQTSNNPIVLMVKPDVIMVQEIKVLPSKAKIQDVVAIRHPASNSDQPSCIVFQHRTTMILLCEDGSLRIYMANVDATNFWMSPNLQPKSPIAVLKPVKKKKIVKSGRTNSSISFPVDFFEHCQHSNDVEFGGNDILQIYNAQQVKNRLNTSGLYIASTKPNGFNIEITNTNNSTVPVGVRIFVGSQTIERSPSYIEVFRRQIPIQLNGRARWFDIPFTREESLTADKKFDCFFGCSMDPNAVTMVDSVKVYVKTKEAFGWPEEPEDFPEPTASTAPKLANTCNGITNTEAENTPAATLPLTGADRLLGSALGVLDGAFTINGSADNTADTSREIALNFATSLLTLTCPDLVQLHTKSLLASLFATKTIYHNHKDQAQLKHVMSCLSSPDLPDIDVEAFQHMLVTARSVSVSRPVNLVKFAEAQDSANQTLEVTDLEEEQPAAKVCIPATLYSLTDAEKSHFTSRLVEAFWRLHASKPANPMLAPVCLPGLTNIDVTVSSLVEVIHAFTLCDPECVQLATKHYVRMLLSPDPIVSFSCRQALIRVLRPRHKKRRVYIPSPPLLTPQEPEGNEDDEEDKRGHADTPPVPFHPSQQDGAATPPPEQDQEPEPDELYEVVDNNMLLDEGMGQANGMQGFEALWGMEPNFPPMVEIPPDADDEAMVELAIALSLQEQGGGQVGQLPSVLSGQLASNLGINLGQPGNLAIQGLAIAPPSQEDDDELEEQPLSDTTASAPASDDEIGSTAATDGSTLRTSPAEQGGGSGAGSESGGSAVDSISATSGRSSSYGFHATESLQTGAKSDASSYGAASGYLAPNVDNTQPDTDTTQRLHSLRLRFLETLLNYFPEVQKVGGVRSVPFMQVLLMLTTDLESDEDKDRAALDLFLTTVIKELDLSGKDFIFLQDLQQISVRNDHFEVKLILLRLVSVLLSRSRSGSKYSSESSFVSNKTASALLQSGTVPYCLQVLTYLLPYWKNFNSEEEEPSNVPGQLLKPHPSNTPPDMSPFFLRQYVKGHASNIFQDYPQLLTEMVLRLPYQLKKISDEQKMSTAVFDTKWQELLSEYMLTQQTPFVKRQVRKLLLFICGSKEKYRLLRDDHTIQSNLQQMTNTCKKGGMEAGSDTAPHSIILPYDTLLTMIEHLKVVCDIASSRPYNWQLYCKLKQDTLPYLIQASISLDEGVAPTLLQLLQCAICGVKGHGQAHSSGSGSSSTSPVKVKSKKEKDTVKIKTDDVDTSGVFKKEAEDSRPFDDSLCRELVRQLNATLDKWLLIKFVRTYLLDSNSSSNRWMAHALILQIYRNSTQDEQQALLDSLWDLWHEVPVFGRKAAQFVDLLGYFLLKTPGLADKKVSEYLHKAVSLLKEENQILAHHPNATIYNMLQGLVDFDGYYLESDPCLVCNNPEVPFQTLKLSAVKVDSKFTTTTQIVKLVGSHIISKISLRISDLKRTKMVQTMNIYYNNRSVQAVVELRNRPGLWHKAKKVKLTSGQTEVKVEFPIPIIACNLMIEYADFYDNLQATAETLQCPRCSASVPASPGVCGNCGENVYQCHKCRSINYDEKDPFLCNSCGFCKYAKFDLTLLAKPCCAVDPIENEEDRKKAISSINSLLEKADRIYKQLQLHRPVLESLLIQVAEHGSDRPPSLGKESNGAAAAVPVSSVNKAIQLLAQKYCGECKAAFDELSKIIQKVMACRRELVEYDQQQRDAVATKGQVPTGAKPKTMITSDSKASKTMVKEKKECLKVGSCFGCASAAVEHCITLLRALVTNSDMRQMLCNQGMIKQLIDYNLRHGALSVRTEVRTLLCLLTRDNRKGTEEMNNLVMTRITAAIKGHQSNPDLGSSVRHEIMLLATSLHQDDSCWEQRTRCVMRLFLMGMQMRNPVIMESITLPCLRILQGLVKQDLVSFINGKKKETEKTAADSMPAKFHMDVRKWLAGDSRYSYQNWKKRLPKPASLAEAVSIEKKAQEVEKKSNTRADYLMEKYASRWKQNMWKVPAVTLKLTQTTWLQQAMFSPSSRSARQTACSVIEAISQVFSRRKEVIDMLTSCLKDVGRSGECASEFLGLYKRLISQDKWKFYLAIKGVMLHLADLISIEVDHLQYLEEATLSSDLAQGFALKSLTELLALFIEQEKLKQHYKNRLVGCVLNGYLSLRKLVVQRTKLIDETQEKLLQMLEELTTGTESETKEFMSVCVQTMKKYPLDDYRSPVFIFERLCSIIYPEENDVSEFYLILEKDPQQEDFLQGRMLGNPYSSTEPGMGPLMRDIKNKICTDCELVALLDDDTGMELLVNKKIISLDLPVKEVYKKIWLPERGEGEPMPVLYRMRGLLGDATEDMINSLDSGSEDDIDKEDVYKMATVLKDCGGIEVMLERLDSIRDLVLGKQLMVVLLKLLSYAVNVKVNRQHLTTPELNSINIMLGALNLALWSEQEGATSTKGQTITEQMLHIMEVVLLEASEQSPEKYREFSKQCGDKEQLLMMLDRINSTFVRSNPAVLQALMRLIPFLAFGEDVKMEALLTHFKPYLQFDKFDEEHSQDEEIHLDCFCSIASAIESNANGIRLKNLILEHGMVQTAVNYILKHAPEIKTMLATDSDVWKEFLSKPSLAYILRMLTGLCTKHVPTQNLIAESCIPILHKLEQVSSDQHVGTLAENLLDSLKTNEEAAKKIEEVRQQTRAEKKRLAMAVRKKQLGALGMTTNEKGQVTVKSSVLKQMEDLKEETGLTCCICREGYRYQPQKVLAIYTFSRRCNMEEYESKTRKSVGYSTVTHFNVIHVDCHTAAVRHARGREEWESAALQNANTRCNGLLPLWGPQVQESVFAGCLARHNNYLQECTGIRELNYTYNIHDLKLLLLRFAQEKSFSEESGGGGPQSNMYLVPFIMHMVLYAINTTRTSTREEKNVNSFLDMPASKWVENSGEADGVLYTTALAMHVLTPAKWKEIRKKLLERILITAHVRAVCPLDAQQSIPALNVRTAQAYSSYKVFLVYFGLVNSFFDKLFVKVKQAENVIWTKALFEHIRHNDKPILDQCDQVLSIYQEELLPCQTLAEFIDVIGLLEEINNADEFLKNCLTAIP